MFRKRPSKRRMKDSLGIMCLSFGAILIAGTRFYHVAWYPHLTEAEAFLSLFPYWFAGVALLICAIFLAK